MINFQKVDIYKNVSAVIRLNILLRIFVSFLVSRVFFNIHSNLEFFKFFPAHVEFHTLIIICLEVASFIVFPWNVEHNTFIVSSVKPKLSLELSIELNPQSILSVKFCQMFNFLLLDYLCQTQF